MREKFAHLCILVGIIAGLAGAYYVGSFVWSFDWGPWGRRSWDLGLVLFVFLPIFAWIGIFLVFVGISSVISKD